MEDIKLLNQDAHAYLTAIPPECWSRHAFSTRCKSNMLLNNMCETFNGVLREVRKKPILTLMEWIRRYVMKRSAEKREGVHGLQGRFMPYVRKYLTYIENESRLCELTPSSMNRWEVDCLGTTYVVDVGEKKCDCYHWQLTGLPCAHAFKCILRQRADPKDYVDECYSKSRYMTAYEPSILPMPGVDPWESGGLLEPLPPPFRNLLGRPNTRKRRKEVGEEGSKNVKKPRKRRSCSNCGQQGHTKGKCKNAAVPKKKANDPPPAESSQPGAPTQTAESNPLGRPKLTSSYTVKVREKAEQRKAAKRVAAATNQAPIQETISSLAPIQESQASVSGGFLQERKRKLAFYV